MILDTGPFAMLLIDSVRMPGSVRDRIAGAEEVRVSAISFYEIGQKARLGKWQDMEPFVDDLDAWAARSGIGILPVSGALALAAARLDWDNRDPFDRLIAATVLDSETGFVSQDRAFDALGLARIWA